MGAFAHVAGSVGVIVVDSSVWIDQFRGVATAKTVALDNRILDDEDIAITDVIYMELLRGAHTKAETARVKLAIDQTTMLRLGALDDFEFAAELFRRARSKGHTIRRATDCMIAAVCIREGVPLLHDDADFDRIADVSELKVA
jgi:predicted nucleic acid-binding protein